MQAECSKWVAAVLEAVADDSSLVSSYLVLVRLLSLQESVVHRSLPALAERLEGVVQERAVDRTAVG